MYNPETEDDSLPDTGAEFDVVVEEVDDTPEDDRGRSTADFDPTDEENTKDDDQFPDKVKNRISRMTLALHSERRAKEQRERELNEAVSYARKVSNELSAVRKQANIGERAYVKQVKSNVDIEMERATDGVRKAYEDGDAARLAEAQATLSMVAARKHAVDTYQPLLDVDDASDIPESTLTPTPPPQRHMSNAVQDWVARNEWFNRDRAMTNMALQIHEDLVNDGITAESPRYFRELDAEIQRRSGVQRRQAPPVSSGRTAQRPAPRRIQLTSAEVAVAKAMGVTVEDYARELVKLGGR